MLRAALEHKIEVILSWELADELSRVLTRSKLKRYAISNADVAAVLSFTAPLLPTIELDLALRDPSDFPVVAAAIDGNAEAICTGDRDLLDDRVLHVKLKTRGISVLTAAELVELLAI